MYQKPQIPSSAEHEAQAAPPAGGPLGPDSHPFADLRRLAAYLQNETPEASTPDEPQSHHAAGVGLFAEKLGLRVTLEQRDIARLEAGDLPAIVLLTNGSSRLVLACGGGEKLLLGTGETVLEVDRPTLAKAATGAIFRVQMRAAAPSDKTFPSIAPTLKFYGPLVRAERKRLMHLAMAGWLINLVGLALPFFSMAVFDRVIPHAAYDTLFALAAGVLLALGLEFLLRDARLHLFDAVGQSIALKVQERLASRLLFARLDDLPKSSSSLLQGMPEMDALAHGLSPFIVGLMVDLPFFVVLLVMIASIGGPVAIVPLLGALGLISLHLLSHVMTARAHVDAGGKVRRQSQLAIEAHALRERIRATGVGAKLLGQWERNADDLGFVAHRNRQWQGIAVQGSVVLVQVILVATLVVGTFQIGSAAMTVGALSACTLLLNRMMMPVSQLVGTGVRCAQLARSVSTQIPLLEAEPETGRDKRFASTQTISARLEAHGLGFGYANETKRALQDVSFTIAPGEKVGIIGKTGCGKSTLLKLLLRLHAPSQGKLLFGSHDIQHFDPAHLRRRISYMPQDPALFEGTLEENLTAGLPTVDAARFEAVCRVSGVHDFAGTHPSGYSLEVGHGGQNLSGGERQSVTLARTLLEAADIYVLDEPTAAMDNGLEARLIGDLHTITAQAGLIVATHRLPLLKLVDRIIWLDGGRIIADGPRQEIFGKLGIAA